MSARSCFEKKRYATEDTAQNVATQCWYERQVDLRIYSCSDCGGYHLTSVNTEPTMKEGWRLPKLSARAMAENRKHENARRRR